jgi:hypothetical protein
MNWVDVGSKLRFSTSMTKQRNVLPKIFAPTASSPPELASTSLSDPCQRRSGDVTPSTFACSPTTHISLRRTHVAKRLPQHQIREMLGAKRTHLGIR